MSEDSDTGTVRAGLCAYGLVKSGTGSRETLHGTVPERARTDHNPLSRKEYLLNVTGRVGG
ncbi:hypothetical protein [Streptomyces sp. NPDC058683]|uniref:hypothetical protein n=1 Tax=Streptomyces sp. NPDC058683 TaxID=3346597 RepID=UPI003666F10C